MVHLIRKNFPKERFAWAVSGGVDSIATAYLLKQKGFNPVILHFNQNYVKEDIEAAEKVEDFCVKFGLEYQINTSFKKFISGSLEDFSRKIRYQSLLASCENLSIKYLGLSHNLNDCIESYLVRCLQGNANYCPIPPLTKYDKVSVFRPFLLTEKEKLKNVVAKNGLSCYTTEDPLNQDLKLQRAWVRNQLIPKIEEKYKGLEKVVRKIMIPFIERDLEF